MGTAAHPAAGRRRKQARRAIQGSDHRIGNVRAGGCDGTGKVHLLRSPVYPFVVPTLCVVANRIEADPTGWRSTFLEREACEVCGEPCKRVALAGVAPYVFVGDGVSDRCASLAAERVFARSGLAQYLAASGVAYEPFETLHDVREALEP